MSVRLNCVVRFDGNGRFVSANIDGIGYTKHEDIPEDVRSQVPSSGGSYQSVDGRAMTAADDAIWTKNRAAVHSSIAFEVVRKIVENQVKQ